MTLFWIAAFLVFYTFFGYGIIVWIAVKCKELLSKPEKFPVVEEYPEVTLLIAAYNEADIIERKMENCASLKYPSDRIRFVWVTDGSTDGTPEVLRSYPENIVLHEDTRAGKSHALNRAIKFVTSPIVIMTDANTILNEDSIYLIVREFDNPTVGCVAGEKRVLSIGENAASTEGLYWKYES
ncbi:MAG: glycosyltransferase, partial [Acetatifactor sp.]